MGTFACFVLGAKAALADDNFNPYRSEDCALSGGFEARAAAWDRGHAWATERKTKCR